ncbi:MAG: sodium-dependent bicarbonate transport family permease [Planctomycetota bacterium]
MDFSLVSDNLLSPPVLFFLVGIAARVLRSDLEIPAPIPTLFSLYLLWAIGYKGGVKLNEAGFDPTVIASLGSAVALSFLIPIVVGPVLSRRLSPADTCALAAAFGSVSAVTFITSANFLEAQEIPYGGHMVAALALMEAPAVIVAVLLYRRKLARDRAVAAGGASRGDGVWPLFRESVLSGPVFLLLGSLLVGVLAGPRGYERLQPFTEDVFYGMLVLFLLESGMTAAKKLGDLRQAGVFTVAMGIAIPVANAAITLPISAVLGLPRGDAFLLAILSASASYIAVPAAMRLAVPEANPGVYLTIALGVTFPFNIALGIPLYLWAVGLVTG